MILAVNVIVCLNRKSPVAGAFLGREEEEKRRKSYCFCLLKSVYLIDLNS